MKPKMLIHVSKEEYEQFLDDETHLPQCVLLDTTGLPDCEGHCPRDLVCTLFAYKDPERNVTVEWFACATADDVAQLVDRAVPLDVTARAKRRVKYIAYCD